MDSDQWVVNKELSLGHCDHVHLLEAFGFRVLGSGVWVQGFGFRVQGSGFRVSGFGFRVQGLGFRSSGPGFGAHWFMGSWCKIRGERENPNVLLYRFRILGF